jgi:hypothetical protein
MTPVSMTTMTPVTRWVFTLLSGALLGVAGCTETSAGSPLPTSTTGSGQTVGSSPSSSDDAAAKLAAIEPCTLLTQAELDQYGLRKRDSGNVAGARTCSWTHPTDENGKGGFNIMPGIWDQQGLKDINSSGYSVAEKQLGRHPARQLRQIGSNGCAVVIGVTDSARVDVTASGDPGQGCVLADQFAKLIEPRLPGGDG